MGFLALSSLIAVGSIAALGGLYLIFVFGWWILQVIANWRIFTKAGEAGWKSIIPVYNDYVSYKIAWQTSYFWISFVLEIAASGIDQYTNSHGSIWILTVLVGVIRLIVGIISILYSVKLAKAFGRGAGFAVGLIFLQPIFLLILGFGDDRYYGPDR